MTGGYIQLKKSLIIFDLETTGVDINNDEIVELAAIKYKKGMFPFKDYDKKLHLLIKPSCKIPKEASAIHGITNKKVKNKKSFGYHAERIYKFFKGCDVAGYNLAAFDIPILWRQLEDCGHILKIPNYIDCYKIFKTHCPHTLEGAYKYYRRLPMKNAHSALYDVLATSGVLHEQIYFGDVPTTVKAIEKKYSDTLDLTGQLKKIDGKIVLTFGKYRDTPIEDIPRQYLAWMKKENILSRQSQAIIGKTVTK
jgi:DNA polymerase-3 subunit epsilon